MRYLRLSNQPSRQNLLQLCVIRWIFIALVLVLALLVSTLMQASLPWSTIASVLLALALFNGMVLWRLRYRVPVRQAEFAAHLLVDALLLTVLLFFTGGSTNPLVSYFLIPLIISAAVLRPSFTWVLTAVTVSLYALLLFFYVPLGIFESSHSHGGLGPHFVGMWVNFGFSAVLIAWFVVRMAATLRSNQAEMARNRERQLRDEQIIGIATMAAGAAHELRTPLATMAVLAEELGRDHAEMREVSEELTGQIRRCEAIIADLVNTSADSERIHELDVSQLVGGISRKWSLTRPETTLDVQVAESIGDQLIRHDQGLELAFLNLLNNAADACPDRIGFAAVPARSGSAVRFVIEDHGPGVSEDVVDQFGKLPVSGKPGGLGLGVLLSQASIERLGGRVELFTDPGSGTRLEIVLPVIDTSSHDRSAL